MPDVTVVTVVAVLVAAVVAFVLGSAHYFACDSRLARIHGGDWLVKRLAISVIVSVWQ